MKTTVKNCSAALVSAALAGLIKPNKQYAVLAIGSDRVTGDCIGPVVGSLLADSGITVCGSLRYPVTALNLEHSHTELKLRYPRGLIIAVDSSVGSREDVGSIKIENCGVFPAAAMGKKLRRVGDVSVTAIVTDKKENLGTVRLGLVTELATAIAEAVKMVFAENRNAPAIKFSL